MPNVNYGKIGNGNREQEKKQSAHASLDDRENIIIDLLEEKGTIVRKDVEAALCVSQATAVLILRKMVEKGVLCKENGGKYLRYRLKTTE